MYWCYVSVLFFLSTSENATNDYDFPVGTFNESYYFTIFHTSEILIGNGVESTTLIFWCPNDNAIVMTGGLFSLSNMFLKYGSTSMVDVIRTIERSTSKIVFDNIKAQKIGISLTVVFVELSFLVFSFFA
jgi:hypothetical protein